MAKEYVYVLTHIPTGKKYVGRSYDPVMREKKHINLLKKGKHPCKAMQDDFTKYGTDYLFKVICENNTCRQTFDLERQWMENLKTYDERYGYNFNDFGVIPIRKKHGLPVRESNAKGKHWRKNGH